MFFQASTFLKAGFQSHVEALWGFQEPPKFTIAEGSVLESDWWSSGSDIYMAQTATWSPEKLERLSQICQSELVARGTVVITFSVELPPPAMESTGQSSCMNLMATCEVKLCGGAVTTTAFMYQKAGPVFIHILSPREKAKGRSNTGSASAGASTSCKYASDASETGNNNATTAKKERRAFFPDTESDTESESESVNVGDHYDEEQEGEQRPLSPTLREVASLQEQRPKTSRR